MSDELPWLSILVVAGGFVVGYWVVSFLVNKFREVKSPPPPRDSATGNTHPHPDEPFGWNQEARYRK
ncbi:MAG: hypothetical protein V1809_11105 [Planctomycetota bacterium]